MSDSGYGHDDISCITYDIHVYSLLGCVDICDGPLHVYFRLVVAHVGKYNYWHCSPRRGNPFQVQGVFRKTAPTRGRF